MKCVWHGTQNGRTECPQCKVVEKDLAILRVWLAIREISDDPEFLSDEDLELWRAVTMHPTIQRRLTKTNERTS